MIRRRLLVLVVVLAASLAATTAVRATSSGQLCPSFSKGGFKYQWETAGTGWTCASAKPWVLKMIADHVRPRVGLVPLKNGPKSLHCFAVSEQKGYVTGGVCYRHTLAFPRSGFTWNGS
jgi:hypothetical protein